MTQVYISHSPEDTEAIGAALGGSANDIHIIAMYGGMGSGKTAMTRGIAAGLGCSDRVCSPTYTIVNEYRGVRNLCHFDLYRLDGGDALYDIGWEDYLASGALCVVEWSENAGNAIPKNATCIRFEIIDNDTRKITISSQD